MKKEYDEKNIPLYPPLSERLAATVGQLHSVESLPQGTASQVSILSSAYGRFVLKVAHIPPMANMLVNECHILTALQQYTPFVAQPLGDAQGDQGHAFLFTCIEGEPFSGPPPEKVSLLASRSKDSAAQHFCQFGTGEDRQIEDTVSLCNPCERGLCCSRIGV